MLDLILLPGTTTNLKCLDLPDSDHLAVCSSVPVPRLLTKRAFGYMEMNVTSK